MEPPELNAFRAAASRRGAYAEQIAAARVAVAACLALASPGPHLLALRPELARLLCNISCRLSQRDPALRPIRDELAAINSRVRLHVRLLGLVSDPPDDAELLNEAADPCALLQSHGPRHLCGCGCYLRAYEDVRNARAAEQHGKEATDCVASPGGVSDASESVRPEADSPDYKKRQRGDSRSPCSTAMCSDTPPRGARVASPMRNAVRRIVPTSNERPRVVTSRFFTAEHGTAPSSAPTPKRVRTFDAACRAGCNALATDGDAAEVVCEQAAATQSALSLQTVAAVPWRPPHSPFGLLEELFWDRPWALLLCCILLNQTKRAKVDAVLARLLEQFPDAAAMAAADVAAIEETLRPLGLHRRRARTVIAFSAEFLKGAWRRPEELPGIGRYGSDAHAIFCEGRWAEVQPHDHALRWYVTWLQLIEHGAT